MRCLLPYFVCSFGFFGQRTDLRFKLRFSLIGICFWSFTYSQNWKDSVAQMQGLYSKGDYSQTEDYYQRNYQNAKNLGGFDNELAQISYRKNDYSKALNYFHKQLSKTKNPSEIARLKFNIGNCYMQQKKFNNAYDAYKSSLKLNPTDVETRYNLNQALRQMKAEQKEPPPNTSNNSPNPKDNQNEPPNEQSSSIERKEMDKKLDELLKQEATVRRRFQYSKDNHQGNPTNDW
jgi:tetratricopeptide (TPR) repeat protein